MEYIKIYKIHYFVLYLILTTFKSTCITLKKGHHPDFRRHIASTPTDWELGLREAVHQALLRDHHTEPGLHDQLLEAPLIGRQNAASPFGDIAVLARGQLYLTPGGFKFLQDSDDVDVDNTPYLGPHHRLLALWTVKRIRHRDPHYGHVFEIEYTISPITAAINEDLVRRHGIFNYNVPGHIFVVRSDPRLNSNHLGQEEWYREQFKPGIVIGVTPDGQKHVLHSFPGLYSSYRPQTDQTTIDPKEYELYKKLIESLASKTTHSNGPHRFTVTTEKTTTTPKPTFLTTLFELTEAKVIPLTPTTVQSVRFPTTPIQYPTTATQVQYPQFTTQVVQLPTTQGVQLPTTQSVQLPTTQVVQFPTTQGVQLLTTQAVQHPTKTTQAKHLPTNRPRTTQPIRYPSTTQFKKIQTTTPITTIHYYMPMEIPKPTTTAVKTTRPSTKPTGFDEDFDIFAVITKPARTTVEQKHFPAFPEITSTQPMTPVTEIPKRTRPDSIGEQLPQPEEVETTIPYVTTTIPPIITSRTKSTITEQVPYEEDHEASSTTRLSKTTMQTTRVTASKKTTSGRATERKSTTSVKYTASIPTRPGGMRKTTQAETATGAKTTTLQQISKTEDRKFTAPMRHDTTTKESFVPTSEHQTSLSELTTPEFQTIQTTIVAETSPSTETTTYKKPTTIFEYSYDSTTQQKPTTNLQTTIPSTTYFTTEKLTQTQTTPTTHFYYTTPPIQDTTTPTTEEHPTTIMTSSAKTYFTQTEPLTTNTAQETTNTVEISSSPAASRQETTPSTETTTTPIETTTQFSEQPQPSSTTTRTFSSTGTTSTKSTTPNDFLINGSVDRGRNKLSERTDFNEDDIFGKTATKLQHETTTKRQYIQSDLENALFGSRRSKQLKLSSKITQKPVVTSTAKVIYEGFYAASTSPTIALDSTTETAFDTTAASEYSTTETTDQILTREIGPSTDQSFSTSISIQVNKRNGTNLKIGTSESELKTTENAKSATTAQTVGHTENDTKKALDDAALQLINHARSIDYSHRKEARQAKYKRRNFTIKRRRGQARTKSNNRTERNYNT